MKASASAAVRRPCCRHVCARFADATRTPLPPCRRRARGAEVLQAARGRRASGRLGALLRGGGDPWRARACPLGSALGDAVPRVRVPSARGGATAEIATARGGHAALFSCRRREARAASKQRSAADRCGGRGAWHRPRASAGRRTRVTAGAAVTLYERTAQPGTATARCRRSAPPQGSTPAQVEAVGGLRPPCGRRRRGERAEKTHAVCRLRDAAETCYRGWTATTLRKTTPAETTMKAKKTATKKAKKKAVSMQVLLSSLSL